MNGYDDIAPLLNRNIKRKLPDGTLEFQDDTKLMEGLLGIGQEKESTALPGGPGSPPSRAQQVSGALGAGARAVGGGAKAIGRGASKAVGKFAETARDPEQSPGLARLLGTIATSLSAVEPKSWQHQLGQAAVSGAAGQQADLMRKFAAEGEGRELSGIGGFGISPQERSALVREALQERQVGAQETTAGAAETSAGVREFESISGQEQLQLEYDKLNQPGGPGKLVDVAIGPDGKESDRLHTYEWNPATGKFDKYVGPKLEPGAGVGGSGKEVERFKPLTIEERKTRLESVTSEANRFLEEGGVVQPGFWVDDEWEKGALVKHAQQKSNPFDDGSEKWSRFEAARPYMDLMLALEDVKDKADVTEAEGRKLLDIQNNIDTLRSLAKSPADYTEYITLIRDGANPSDILTLFRKSGGR